MDKCEAGCQNFSGGEIKHHSDCQYYKGSLSEGYDRCQLEKGKISFTKRELMKLFREVFKSAEKMCYFPYEDEKNYPDKNDRRRYQTFIQDDALEYIMRVHTDNVFGGNNNSKKHYSAIFGEKAK